MEGAAGLEVYEKAGVAGLFIVLYITTIWFLIRVLMKDKQRIVDMYEKETERVERLATIVQSNTDSNKQMVRVAVELKDAVQEDTKVQREMMAYFKAKDQFNGRR